MTSLQGDACPKQSNGSDCGMFSVKFADYRSRDLALDFGQRDMQYFRSRTAWELLLGRCIVAKDLLEHDPQDLGACITCGVPDAAGNWCNVCGGPVEPNDQSYHYQHGWRDGPRAADHSAVARPAGDTKEPLASHINKDSEAGELTVTEQQAYIGWGEDTWHSDADDDEEAAALATADPERQLYLASEAPCHQCQRRATEGLPGYCQETCKSKATSLCYSTELWDSTPTPTPAVVGPPPAISQPAESPSVSQKCTAAQIELKKRAAIERKRPAVVKPDCDPKSRQAARWKRPRDQ